VKKEAEASLSNPRTKASIIRDTIYRYQNLLMVVGLVLSFSGGSWDITFHILSQPESFFSYPHSLVYSGILLVISIFFINVRKNFAAENKIKKNNLIILSGIVLILVAGPFDFSWHLKFGLDGLLSPPHLTLLSGWLLIAIGNLRITNLHLDRIRTEKEFDRSKTIANSDGARVYVSGGRRGAGGRRGVGGRRGGAAADVDSDIGLTNDKQVRMNNQGYNSWNEKSTNSNTDSESKLYRLQLFLNLSILLMILSGILYFFSLPFSETQSYNFNPPPLLALFVYGLGFPILFSAYLVKILLRYPDLKVMVPLVGTFYVTTTLITQISSNFFLSGYAGYYLLNLIPFALFYVGIRYYYYRSKKSGSANKEKSQLLNSEKKNTITFSRLPFKYAIFAVIFAVLSYPLCFPLNTYVYNEELYGYLIYQNLVVKVYEEILYENYNIIVAMSVAGGCIGYMILQATNTTNKVKATKTTTRTARTKG
jgi:cbb3-type cytochrome oxidase subunit 3